jgi:molybdate transport system substrate-binding protein
MNDRQQKIHIPFSFFSKEARYLTRLLILCMTCLLTAFVVHGQAEEVRVAVASNFVSTMKILKSNFEHRTNYRIIIISGSSGKLYAQIQHGAPFDVFFSADQYRPTLLEKEKVAIKGSRFPYAEGRLTLWSPKGNFIQPDGKTTLTQQSYTHLAIANPKTAPYGRAAEQTLRSLGLWENIKSRLVYGENIAQTFQFVSSQNAELGFVAHSQVLSSNIQQLGSRWDVPPTLHDPVIQEAVLLNQGATNTAALDFMEYMITPPAHAIIRQHGYGIPHQRETP